MEKWSVSPFSPPIQVRRGGLWAKHKGLKRGAIGNTLGEHIENPLGTCKEQFGNNGNMKKIFSPPNPKLKKIKIKAL